MLIRIMFQLRTKKARQIRQKQQNKEQLSSMLSTYDSLMDSALNDTNEQFCAFNKTLNQIRELVNSATTKLSNSLFGLEEDSAVETGRKSFSELDDSSITQSNVSTGAVELF